MQYTKYFLKVLLGGGSEVEVEQAGCPYHGSIDPV